MRVTANIVRRGEATNLKPHTASQADILGPRCQSPNQAAERRHARSVQARLRLFCAPMQQGAKQTDNGEGKMNNKIKTAAAMVAISVAVWGGDLIHAIGEVESRNRDTAVGDHGKAVGRYQIHVEAIEDVNRICGTNYTPEDRSDPAKAREILEAYIAHWAAHYERTQGKPATDEIRARIWNGGPNGWRRESTLPYWKKVQKTMKITARKGAQKTKLNYI